MLHYIWNDFMISAQMASGKIIVSAVPTNIRNLTIDTQDVERIERAFQGQITESHLQIMIGQERKQLKDIIKFYHYLCKTFNHMEIMRIHQKEDLKPQRISISKQWAGEEGSSKSNQSINQEERIIIKVFLDNQLQQGKEVKEEQNRLTYTIKLKEKFLTINSLLLKCNSIVLAELDYHKQAQQRFEEKISQIHKKIRDQMTGELKSLKKQMKKLLENTMSNFCSNVQNQEYECEKRNNRKSLKNRQQVKIQRPANDKDTQNSNTARKQPSDDPEISNQAKTEENEVKFEADEEAKRLKRIEDLHPQQQIVPVPIQFDDKNPAYHFFAISNKSVTKIGGFDYPMMMLKKIIPGQGTHGVIIKYVVQKKQRRSCCLQVGIIDEKMKSLLHSSVWDNYIKFKFNCTTIFTKVNGKQTKKKVGRLRVLRIGETVQIRVNFKQGLVSWIFSYGQVARAEIPKQLRRMNMQVFVGIFTTGDTVEFVDYSQ